MLKETHEKEVEQLLKSPEVCFLNDLRQYIQHYDIPILEASLSMTNINPVTHRGESSHDLLLRKESLIKWNGWHNGAKTFLSNSGNDSVDLKKCVMKQKQCVDKYYDVLYRKIAQIHKDDIEEVQNIESEIKNLQKENTETKEKS